MRVNTMRHKIRKLKRLLGKERAKYEIEKSKVLQVSEELQKTHIQLRKKKFLKDVCFKKVKETKAELLMLQKYSDPETLKRDRIAALARNTAKQKTKKALQKDYEELQVAYITTQERLEAELKMEKDKNKALQEELENMAVVNGCKNESEAFAAMRRADNLQREAEGQTVPPDATASQHEEFTTNQGAEYEKMADLIAVMEHMLLEKSPASGRHPYQ